MTTLRAWVASLLRKLLYAMSHWRELSGIRVGVLPIDDDTAGVEACLSRVGLALSLIEQHAPRRFSRLRCDVKQVWVSMRPTHLVGQWDDDDSTCILQSAYVLDASTSPVALAGTIVHEAMHARLSSAGVLANEERIERACWRAELAFTRRVPAAEDHVELLEAALGGQRLIATDVETQEGTREAIDTVLRSADLPRWLRERLVPRRR